MSLRVLVSLKFPVTSCTYSYTKYLLLNGSLVMASGQSVRSFFTPAAKKCKYLEQTHQMADGIRPDQASMIKDSLDRGFCSMRNFVWTWQHIYVSVKSKLQHPPPRHLTFLKIILQIPSYPSQNAVQMPHTVGFIQLIKCPHLGDISNFPYYPLCRSSWSWSRVCRQVAIDSTVFILICSVTALW